MWTITQHKHKTHAFVTHPTVSSRTKPLAMKPLLCLVLLATATLAEEPAIEVLIADSPIIVVAEPVFEKGFPPLGECSEIVLVKYSVKFKIRNKKDARHLVDMAALGAFITHHEICSNH
jgi:hypothetical protein